MTTEMPHKEKSVSSAIKCECLNVKTVSLKVVVLQDLFEGGITLKGLSDCLSMV